MLLHRFIHVVLWLCASLLWLPAQANLLGNLLGGGQPKFLPAEQAFPLQTQLDQGQLLASWTTHPEYYLYKHRLFLEQGTQQLQAVYFSQAGIEKQDDTYGLVTAFYGPLEARFNLSNLTPGEVTLNYQGCAEAGLCYPPQTVTLTLTVEDIAQTAAAPASPPSRLASNEDNWFAGRSVWALLAIFFALGLGLTFTPCVLPMVPILTSVVLGQGTASGKRGFLLSSTYVIGMALTYATAGVMMGLLGAGANVSLWLQNPWVLSIFAGLFLLLALSMFGLYELQLPAILRNRLNNLSSQQQGGRYLSVFVMGMLSALIVSPCISAPLAAALMYISTTGDALQGGLALLALGLGMGVPLVVLGTTGASALPKAGAWMEQVKIFFGMMLLAVAVWLLARIIPEPISLALWATLAISYSIVLGALEPATTLAQRWLKALAWLFLVYGVLALIGALMGNGNPLQPLAMNAGITSSTSEPSTPFYRTDSVTELEQQIANAPSLVMVDLYADWCISCKVIEQKIFAQDDVKALLADARWLQLDLTANRPEHMAFMQKHGLFGPPTVLFFKHNQELNAHRMVGELSKAEFVQRAQNIDIR